jgi:hypothetical protein
MLVLNNVVFVLSPKILLWWCTPFYTVISLRCLQLPLVGVWSLEAVSFGWASPQNQISFKSGGFLSREAGSHSSETNVSALRSGSAVRTSPDSTNLSNQISAFFSVFPVIFVLSPASFVLLNLPFIRRKRGCCAPEKGLTKEYHICSDLKSHTSYTSGSRHCRQRPR